MKDILKPMNACSIKDEARLEALWDDPNYIAEEKLDGCRYTCQNSRFISRNLVDKTENLPHLEQIFKEFPKAMFDGEIHLPGMKSNDVTKITGALPEKAIARQEKDGYLQYALFDMMRTPDGEWIIDKPWHERRKCLEDFYNKHLKDNEFVTITEVIRDNKRKYCQKIMQAGKEGIVLKNINAKYVPDKRPIGNWVKVKQELTDDVIIIDFIQPVKEYTGKQLNGWPYWENENGEIVTAPVLEGNKLLLGSELKAKGWKPVTRNYAMGWIGSIVFGKYNDNNELVELGSCSGMSDNDRAMFSRNPSRFIGKVIKISAMEITKDGHYRHPQFLELREDKPAGDCRTKDVPAAYKGNVLNSSPEPIQLSLF